MSKLYNILDKLADMSLDQVDKSVQSTKTSGMTQPVGIDTDGKLWTTPGGGSGEVSSVNGKTGDVTLDAEDVGALPNTTAVPTKTSDLTNDSGFLTQHQSLDAYRTSSEQDAIDAGKIGKSAQAEKTVNMTQPVGVDSDGKLWVSEFSGTAKRYGYRREKSNSNPSDRIVYMYDAVGMIPAYMDFENDEFVWGDWKKFVEEIARPVMLKSDGTVDYELDHGDQTKKLDGTESDIEDTSYDGGAMVEFNDSFCWIKRWEDARYEYVVFSNQEIDSDYHAYAHTGSDGKVKSAFYWGMFGGINIDSKMKSIGSGTPMVHQTREAEITCAKALGEGWHTIFKSGWDYISDLLTLICKNDNSQEAYGVGYSASTNTSVIANGTTNSKGCFWGDDTGLNSVKTLWIENYWGNYWQAIAGLVCDTDGTVKAKMFPPYCDTPVSDPDFTEYSEIGNVSGSLNGFADSEQMNEFGYFPKSINGSGTTYMCDKFYYDMTQATLKYGLVGGIYSHENGCGSRGVSVHVAANYGGDYMRGSRPAYIS